MTIDHIEMVPTAGVEPAQVAPLAPQTSASTNFATSAFCHLSCIKPFLSTRQTNHHGLFDGAGAGAVAGAGCAGAGTEETGCPAGAGTGAGAD